MSPTIDGQAINSREDWRHQYIPGRPQSVTEEQFPGIAQRFVEVGPTMPPSIELTGFLVGHGATVAAAFTALHEELDKYAQIQSSMITKTLGVHDTTLGNCMLASFDVIGRPHGYAGADVTDGNVGVRVFVRMLWRQLAAD